MNRLNSSLIFGLTFCTGYTVWAFSCAHDHPKVYAANETYGYTVGFLMAALTFAPFLFGYAAGLNHKPKGSAPSTPLT